MRSVGEFLAQCGGRLAPFERQRVGKVGCFVALAAMGGAAAALGFGAVDAGGSWHRPLRVVILSGLGAVILLFLIYAVAETLVERSVWRRVREYARESGTDHDTLLRAAETRRSRMAGGDRLVALLRERRT